MGEREICCCGSSGWTRVIGWFQIVGAILWLGILGVMLMDLAIQFTEGIHTLNADEKTGIIAAMLIFALTMGLLVLALIMAIILLRGSHNKNARQINAWLIYTKILVVVWALLTIAQLSFIPVGMVASKLLSLIFGLAMEGFCIWVVGIHKKEIEASSGVVIATPDHDLEGLKIHFNM